MFGVRGRDPRTGLAIPESETMTTKIRHPAPWNRKALAAAADRLVELLGDPPLTILDPYAGVGRIHELRECGFVTVGGELEKEWAATSEYTVVADALHFPADDASFDAVVTSPVFGNRLGDHHDAQERCQPCKGTGTVVVRAFDVLDRVNIGTAEAECEKCDGTGRRDHFRNTYRHALGRMPSVGSSATMQFGTAYRRHHRDWLVEAMRLVRPSGLIVVNVGNFIRKGVEVDVVGWWLGAMVGEGLLVRAVDRVPAAKLRVGANRDLRVDGEINIVCEVRA